VATTALSTHAVPLSTDELSTAVGQTVDNARTGPRRRYTRQPSDGTGGPLGQALRLSLGGGLAIFRDIYYSAEEQMF
jgi:hypothetical protein